MFVIKTNIFVCIYLRMFAHLCLSSMHLDQKFETVHTASVNLACRGEVAEEPPATDQCNHHQGRLVPVM